RTYHELSCMDILWPYKDKKTFVVSHKAIDTKENIEFITDNIIERISDLKNRSSQDIWLAGGGELITMCINAGLVDEMQICYIPCILCLGTSLFTQNHQRTKLEFIANIS